MESATPLAVALEAAAAGARVLRRHYGEIQKVSFKGIVDLVTEQDKRSEAVIAQTIRRAFPEHAILGEESGLSGASPNRWIVDPLDGTTNYAHGYPMFAVSIAYEENGQLRVGVVVDPLRREIFAAQRGLGATLNGQPIQVSNAETLLASVLETGFPYRRDRLELALRQFVQLAPLTQGLRRSGSAALGLAYVAAGRLDGFWEATLNSWDMAAGALLIEEAGGTVSQIDGSPYRVDSTDIAASNGRIHAALIRELTS
ncbi:MAG TPA: inositol monophosphatase family protein [Chloroflexota bacterium]|nr:inositol monophosphatase family protein [Chloroflexota bacterium]